jgi:protein-disulfide isomerase
MTRMLHTIAAAALLVLAAAAPLKAQAFNEGQRSEIERIVKEYLIAHPEVLQEAMAELEKRQAVAEAEKHKTAVKEYSEALFRSTRQVTLGNPEGDVTLVEFFDYNCGYCKRGLADMLKLLQTDKNLKVVLRDYPILTPGSIEAADVALAVKNQIQGDKFLQFHQELLSSRGAVGKDRALEVAQSVGVDMSKLQADMSDPGLRKSLASNLQLGETLGINGTPSYVIGSELVPGAVGYDALKQKIDSMRKCGQTVCS